MAKIWRGGWSKVEYDDNVGFATPTEIPNILEEGTGIEPETPTEALGNGGEAAAGKSVRVNIRSKDLTAAVYAELVAAEEADTPLFFRFTGVDTAYNIIVKKVIPIVDYDLKSTGASNARKVTGKGFAVTESGLIAVTMP